MKKINFYIFIIIMLIPVIELHAQNNKRNNIKYQQINVTKDGDMVRTNMIINIDSLDLRSKDMVIITPTYASIDSAYVYSEDFSPVVVAGSRRYKALNRDKKLNGSNCELTAEEEPYVIVRHRKRDREAIYLSVASEYRPWMRNAHMVMDERTTGCACNDLDAEAFVVTELLPPLFTPSYALTYVNPPVEPVKQRSESHTARLNFEVNKSVLLSDYKNNSEVLTEVRDIVMEIRNDTNLNITKLKVTGYASPEGPRNNNIKLSENRAKSFVEYLQRNYNISPSYVDVEWKGEDWDGFRRAVQASNIQDKAEVLRIVDNEPDTEKRKVQLRQLSNGTTWRVLLDEIFPPLRRNEYTISYVAKPFDVQVAKELIKTKPQHLSQNEMFLVANTYPRNSEEFKEVFDIAVRMYPDNDIAQLNAAALEIENGSYDNAQRRLEKINLPEAWNNLGVILSHKQQYNEAMKYYERASQAGLEEATKNLEQLKILMEEL